MEERANRLAVPLPQIVPCPEQVVFGRVADDGRMFLQSGYHIIEHIFVINLRGRLSSAPSTRRSRSRMSAVAFIIEAQIAGDFSALPRHIIAKQNHPLLPGVRGSRQCKFETPQPGREIVRRFVFVFIPREPVFRIEPHVSQRDFRRHRGID